MRKAFFPLSLDCVMGMDKAVNRVYRTKLRREEYNDIEREREKEKEGGKNATHKEGGDGGGIK